MPRTRKSNKSSVLGLAVLFVNALAASALASDVYINLAGRSGQDQVALGMPPFIAERTGSGEEALAARKIQEIIRQDLLFSRYVAISQDGPPFTGANAKSISAQWKTRGSGWLLTGKASLAAPKIAVTIQLINLDSGEAAFERYYRQDQQYLRSSGHRIADDIVRALTGKPGIAHTQIAFSGLVSGHKEIFIMDYDGENLKQLTRDGSIDLLPRFSPSLKQLAYTSYKAGNPDLYLLDLERGQTRLLSREQGLNIAGGFSPDGSQLLMTMSAQKNPNVYLKTLSDGSLTRLTQHFGVDTSPTFSPDGAQVAFVSDRSGNPQIYVMALATQKAKRLTHNMNWCDSPAWSPTGEWVVFAGRYDVHDKMDIFLVDLTGNQVRQLTHGEGSNEDPSWAPDGRFIAFSSNRAGHSEIFVMDADGSAPHKLAETPMATFTPTWSH